LFEPNNENDRTFWLVPTGITNIVKAISSIYRSCWRAFADRNVSSEILICKSFP
jgi:hypothetical protein